MSELYVVTRGSWDAFCWDAIFTNEPAAREYIAAQPEPESKYFRVNDEPEVWTAYETAEAALTAQAIRDASVPNV